MTRVAILLALISLSACGSKPQIYSLGQPATWAVVYDPGAERSNVEGAVRERCGAVQFCRATGWSDPSRAAKALPMTDRELAAVKFDYVLNRVTGADEFHWR